MSDGLSNTVNKLKFCVCELFEEVNSIRTTLNKIISDGQEFFIKRYTTDELPSEEKEGTLAYDTTLEIYVYYKDNAWYKVSDDTIVKTTLYDIYIITGQSNAGGNGLVADLSGFTGDSGLSLDRIQDDVFFSLNYHEGSSNTNPTTPLFNGEFKSMTPGETTVNTNLFNGEISFGDSMNTLRDIKPAIIKYFINGAGISKFDKLSSNSVDPLNPNNGWDGLTRSINTALQSLTDKNIRYNIQGIIWWQGESDSNEPNASNYQVRLTNFISNIRDFTNIIDLPFCIVETQNMSTPNDVEIVQQTERTVANADSKNAFIITSDITSLMIDNFHWSAEGHVTIGKRIAVQMNRLIDGIIDWKLEDLGSKLVGSYDVSNSKDSSRVIQSSGSVSEVLNQVDGVSSQKLVQTVVADQPQIIISDINGSDTFQFADDTDFIESDAGFFKTVDENLQNFHLFFVLKYPDLSAINISGGSGILFRSKDNFSLYSHCPITNIDPNVYFNTRKSPFTGADQDTFLVGDILLDNTPMILQFGRSIDRAVSGNDALKEFRLNGSTISGSGYKKQNANIGLDIISKELVFSPSALPCKVNIGEIVAINGDVNDSERQKIEGFLAHKWGLTSYLPSDHPYKNVQP